MQCLFSRVRKFFSDYPESSGRDMAKAIRAILEAYQVECVYTYDKTLYFCPCDNPKSEKVSIYPGVECNVYLRPDGSWYVAYLGGVEVAPMRALVLAKSPETGVVSRPSEYFVRRDTAMTALCPGIHGFHGSVGQAASLSPDNRTRGVHIARQLVYLLHTEFSDRASSL